MSMNGIDISNWQKGIDLTKVPCDFVIIKATQGVSYVNPDCDRAYQQAKNAGKCLGVYHYFGGGDATAEADYFVKNVQGYIGEAILVLDWESNQNSKFSQGAAVAKIFLDRVYTKTGVKPLIYMSKSVCRSYDWSSVVAGDYGLWCAQYADNNPIGYQSNPWTDNKGMGAFKSMAIFQYSSHGQLAGYDGDLDINIAYMAKTAWAKYAAKNGKVTTSTKPTPTVSESNTVTYTVREGDTLSTIAAKYGTTYQKIATDNGISNPNKIYAGQVLKITKGTTSMRTYYTVKAGDTLSRIAVMYGTTIAKLQSLNGIKNANVIYAGTKIRVK